MDGTITSNESAASAPWLAGSESRGIIFSISAKVLGQPCVITIGIELDRRLLHG